MFGCFITIGIYKIGRLSKGKERNSQRQDDMGKVKVAATNIIDGSQKEIGILEIAK